MDDPRTIEERLLDRVEEELKWYWERGDDPKQLEALIKTLPFSKLCHELVENATVINQKEKERIINIGQYLEVTTPWCQLVLFNPRSSALFNEGKFIKFLRADTDNDA